MNNNKIKFLFFILLFTFFPPSIFADILPNARVFYYPNGKVAITYFLTEACNGAEISCMDKIFSVNHLKDLPYDDIPIDQIPKDHSTRDKWRGEKGRGIWIDNSLITKTEKLEELKTMLNNESDKNSPNLQKVFKLQRKIEKIEELKTDNNILSIEQLDQIEERKLSFIAGFFQRIVKLFNVFLKRKITQEVSLGGVILTKEQYNLLKTDLVQKVDNMKTAPLSFDDAAKWREVVRKECPNFTLTNVKSDDIIKAINNKLALGKC